MSATQNILIKLTLNGIPIEGSVALPTGRSPQHSLLPALQGITDTITQIATMQARDQGLTVSCKKGCDACCHQMVPIAPAEAFALAAGLDGLTPAVAAPILERFDQAVDALEDKGLLESLQKRHTLSRAELHTLDRAYFAAQIPCPFLIDHACSIHPIRPLACREYLVTSPAPHCSNPQEDRVRQLPLDAKPSRLLTRNHKDWLPLTLARQFVATHREPSLSNPAQSLLALLKRL